MEKIKRFYESEMGKDILVVIIIIFVGLCSFGLGRLSKESSNNGLKIEYPSQNANILSSFDPNIQNKPILKAQSVNTQKDGQNSSGSYFASSRGKKYYSVGCSAGNNIKQENRIYFSTTIEAEQKGYTLSNSCK